MSTPPPCSVDLDWEDDPAMGRGGAAQQGGRGSRAPRVSRAPATADDDAPTRPLFYGPEQILQAWARGIPSGCKALPLEPEGGTGSAFARAERLFVRSERYVVACATMRRAFASGLRRDQAIVCLYLIVRDESWDQAASAAGLDDPALAACSVKQRVYRAYHAGLRAIQKVM